MKHPLQLLLVVFFGLANLCYGQETIYFANGDKLPKARLTDATDQKVVFTVPRASGPSSYTFQRSNVLMAFNRAGEFLLISSLSPDAATARQQIEQFSAGTGEPRKTDFLVKSVPLQVIPATISYESDEVVNYQTTQGTAASISKAELMMILRRDGRHQLLMSPVDVASSLVTIRQQIVAGGTTTPTPPAPVTPPASVSVAAPPAPTTPGSPAEPTAIQPIPDPKVVVVINNGTPTPPPSNPAVTEPTAPTEKRVELTEAELLRYREKALRRVDEFAAYLNVITDKSLSMDMKDRAIEQAARLFLPDATIQVTSKSRPGVRAYPIRDYLTRLKLLPYSRADVEWSEIQYVKELTQAADGNYYGTITGQQTFTGYGGANGHNVIYSDVTQKNVKVKLQSYQKMIGDQVKLNWEVLLGNIGVANH